MTFILALLRSKLARQIGAAILLVLSVISFGLIQKRKGARQERQKQKDLDNENANSIRDRVDAANGMRDDKSGYRD